MSTANGTRHRGRRGRSFVCIEAMLILRLRFVHGEWEWWIHGWYVAYAFIIGGVDLVLMAWMQIWCSTVGTLGCTSGTSSKLSDRSFELTLSCL